MEVPLRSIDPRSGAGALLPLRVLLVASLVLPALLFAYGAAVRLRRHEAEEAMRRARTGLRKR